MDDLVRDWLLLLLCSLINTVQGACLKTLFVVQSILNDLLL